MDELAYRHFAQEYGQIWDRGIHARLLDRLKADGAKLVVFDFPFADPGNAQTNDILADAIAAHGQVVLAADRVPLPQFGYTTLLPQSLFVKAARSWGIAEVQQDGDGTVRRHSEGTIDDPPLAWAAASLFGLPPATTSAGWRAERWIRYYGTNGVLPSLPYHRAFDMPPGHFRDKVVFVGGKPRTAHVAEETDEFRTALTPFAGTYTSGVEVTATMFLNLIHGDWLRRLPESREALLFLAVAAVFGFGLPWLRPLPGAGVTLLGMAAAAVLGFVAFVHYNIAFPWLIAAVQIPCAWLWSAGLLGVAERQRKSAIAEPSLRTTPAIAGHTLLRCIGRGAYGEVWLARDVIDCFHAVKIVYRRSFSSDGPFEREFKGIQKFTPISRTHPGFVHILHVDRDVKNDFFYYVMEAGDDEESGQKIEPDSYSPKTLASQLAARGRISIEECLSFALSLTAALSRLHEHNLIHRDIKPANIIFVNGAPKLADVGLVTEVGGSDGKVSFVGTEGYIPPEGPGTAAADIYSLGKVLYQAAMGRDCARFPELPTTIVEHASDMAQLLDLNEIVLKACSDNVAERYQTAAELQAALLALQQQWLSTKR